MHQQHAIQVGLSQIESAHVNVPIELHSPEARHFFRRRFDWLQKNLYDVLVRHSSRLPGGLAKAESEIRSELENSTRILNDAAAQADRRLRSAGITSLGTYRPRPLVLQVPVFSGYARRYLTLLEKFDQMMLLLEAMDAQNLISAEEMKQQTARAREAVRHVFNCVLNLLPDCDTSEQRAG